MESLALRPPLSPEPLDDPLRLFLTDLDKIIGRFGPLPLDDERCELPVQPTVERFVTEATSFKGAAPSYSGWILTSRSVVNDGVVSSPCCHPSVSLLSVVRDSLRTIRYRNTS